MTTSPNRSTEPSHVNHNVQHYFHRGPFRGRTRRTNPPTTSIFGRTTAILMLDVTIWQIDAALPSISITTSTTSNREDFAAINDPSFSAEYGQYGGTIST